MKFEIVERVDGRFVVCDTGDQRALNNDRVAAALVDQIDRLLVALHDAIGRPKGVVPDSAAEFYDPHRFYPSPIETGEK